MVALISRCTGINNKLDPKRLIQYDQKTGVTDLAEGVNIDIDDSGQVMSRLGQIELSSVPSHSMFQNKGDAFVAQDRTSDTALYLINDDLTLTGIWAGLIKGSYLSYCQVGAQTFYANGAQNGVIEAGVRSSWPDQSGHVGTGTARVFYPAPIGNHIEYCLWLMSMLVAVGNTIYVSEPASTGKFRPNGRRFDFGYDVRMIKTVEGGIWVSTTEEIGFIARAEDFKSLRWVAKPSRKPAHEWSVNCELVNLSKTALQIPGESAIWSSDDGLCVGAEDGQLIVVTEEKLFYPTGSSGATVVDDGIVINSVY